VKLVTERELRIRFEPVFSRFLAEVQGSICRRINNPTAKMRPDLVMETEIRGKRKNLVFEFKSVGQPSYIREAVAQVKAFASAIPNSYPVIVAPYILDQSARIMQSEHVGFFDLAGNGLLDFDGVFVHSQGNPNPDPTTRELKSLFGPRASRLLRFLLTPALVHDSLLKPGVGTKPPILLQPPGDRKWTVEELAELAEVSLGWASAVKRKLLDFEYVREEDRRLVLTKPGELLDEWARNYDPRRHHRIGLYALNQALSLVEDQLARCHTSEEFAKYIEDDFKLNFAVLKDPVTELYYFPYAFTSFVGAGYVGSLVRYDSVTAFFSGPIEEVKREFSAKEVPSGANLNLLVPHDDGVYFCSRQIRGAHVVNPVQLYLDLITDKGRGEEAAQAIRDLELKY
jgi:hypothetical protein